MSDSLWPHGLEPPRFQDSPRKNTGVGCHVLRQRIFQTQGSNPGLPHCRWILYHLSHQGRFGELQHRGWIRGGRAKSKNVVDVSVRDDGCLHWVAAGHNWAQRPWRQGCLSAELKASNLSSPHYWIGWVFGQVTQLLPALGFPSTKWDKAKWRDFPGGSMVKNLPSNAGDTG